MVKLDQENNDENDQGNMDKHRQRLIKNYLLIFDIQTKRNS